VEVSTTSRLTDEDVQTLTEILREAVDESEAEESLKACQEATLSLAGGCPVIYSSAAVDGFLYLISRIETLQKPDSHIYPLRAKNY
jgi:hypothetical protein